MTKFVSAASFLLLAAAAVAQSTANIPNPGVFAGGGSSGNIWRAGINRVQCFYDSSNWTGQGIPQPIVISQLEWRNNAAVAAPITYPSVDIYIQPAAVDYAAPTTTFATNRTIDPLPAPNYSGPVTVQASATTGAYVINIPLTTPITFDPSAGVDLLVEIVINAAPTPLTGTTVDCGYNNPAHLCNSLRSVNSTTALTGAFSAFCPVIKTTYISAPNAASYAPLGAGCIAKYASLYELFASPANFDLQNSAITFLAAGGGYVVARTGSWIPVGSIQAVPTVLALGDDATINYPFTVGSFPGWTGIEVCSNGYVAPAIGNTLTAAPNVNTFLNSTNAAFGCQLDLDPQAPGTGAGTIQVEESAGVTTVTWNGVTNWNSGTGAAPCDIQIQLYANGDVTMAFGANFTTFNPNGGVLVGYSPGGPSRDPGNRDISALGTSSVYIDPADVLPMELAASNRPVFGTNWNLVTSNIDATSVLGVDVFGVTDPGINDLFFLGAPGCGLRASLDVVNAWFVTGSTHTYSFSVPAGQPALQGFNLYTTTATLQVPGQNAFGWMTSNGIQGTLGSI